MREGHATIQSRNGSTVPLTLFGLTKTFTCVQLSNTYLSATLTTATFPTAAACRGFDASACTPTPRDPLSSHWQLRLHFIWKGSQPFIYRCAPRGTRIGLLSLELSDIEVGVGILVAVVIAHLNTRGVPPRV